MRKAGILLSLALLASLLVAAPALAEDRAPASDFELSTLDGKSVKLSELKGKVVVLSFWATWCAPCLQELPLLDALGQSLGDKGLVILAIDVDGSDTMSSVRSTVKRLALKASVLLDPDGAVLAAFNPQGTCPFTVFIDRKGRVAEWREGFSVGDEKGHETLIRTLLDEAP